MGSDWSPVMLLAHRKRGRGRLKFGLMGILIVLAVGCRSDATSGGGRRDEWMAALRSGTTAEKARAAEALGSVLRLQPNSPKVVSALALAVQDTSDAVRLAAASALSADGVDKFAAVSGLHAMIHDTAHPGVRASVAQLIAVLGEERARPLLPAIREALNDSNPRVRAAALESMSTLGSIESGDGALVADRSEDSAAMVRAAAFKTLKELRPPASVLLPVARRGLKDEVPQVRRSAALALCTLGQQARPALDDLIARLEDPDGRTVQSVVLAIAAIGPDAKRALPALNRLRDNEFTEIRNAARTATAAIQGEHGAKDRSPRLEPEPQCREEPS